MANVTKEAAEGYDWYFANRGVRGPGYTDFAKLCPYLNTSDAANAWHLGRELARWGEPRPTPEEPARSERRIAVTVGRGYTLNLRGRCDVLLRRFLWVPGNTFQPVRLGR
jgi:hypothetical protein